MGGVDVEIDERESGKHILNLESLADFLWKAKQLRLEEKLLRQDLRDHTSEYESYELNDGDWKYADIRRGRYHASMMFKPNSAVVGQELVSHDGKPVWGMNYHERISDFPHAMKFREAKIGFSLQVLGFLFDARSKLSKKAFVSGQIDEAHTYESIIKTPVKYEHHRTYNLKGFDGLEELSVGEPELHATIIFFCRQYHGGALVPLNSKRIPSS